MTRGNIDIAPNYALTSSVAQTLSEAMDHRIFSYKSINKLAKDSVPQEIMVSDDMRDRLGYLLYPQNIKGLVSPRHSAMDLVREGFDNLLEHQQLEGFYPKDTLGFIDLVQKIRSGDMNHALATVVDFETITMKDAFGNEKNWIWNAGFFHIHSDATIGAYKKNPFQHIFIGIYDEDEMKYLSSIAEKITSGGGIRSLSREEEVAFDYLSRFGASMRENGITDLATAVPEKFRLTEATKNAYATVDNFTLAQRALKKLGDNQVKASRSGTVPEGVEQIIDNIVETFVNKDSMMTGWNVPYDVSRAIELVESVPGANEYFKNRIKSFGFDPDDYNISELRRRMYDPTNHLIYPSSGKIKQAWYNSFYGTNRDVRDIGTHAIAFDNMLKGLQRQYPDDDIFKDMHHLGGIDVLQEMKAIFDRDSSLVMFEEEAKARAMVGAQKYNKNFSIKGLLLQAQDSGSMSSLQQYSKSIFATVEGSNGDIFMSNGLKYDKFSDKIIRGGQYSPSAWKQNLTYEITGVEYFAKDSKVAQAVAYGKPEMVGSDLVRLQMRVGLLDNSQRLSEMGQRIHSVYMPVEMVARGELGAHFRIIGEIDDQGKPVLNSFGREQAWNINKKVNGRRVDYIDEVDELKPFKEINEMDFLDRAERSFTKRSLSTGNNAVMLRNILDTGTFENLNQNGTRAVQLQKAVLEASKGNTGALDNILKGASVNKTSAQVIQSFIGKENTAFNAAWFSNAFTIADTMKKGSLFAQMHEEVLKVLDNDSYRALFAKNNWYQKQLYSTIMDEGIRSVLELASTDEKRRIGKGLVGRPVNKMEAYWLKADDFIRGYRDEREVITATNSAKQSWIKIDLSNPNRVISSIKQVTGLKGARAENDHNVKRSVLDFLDYLSSKDSYLDKQARDEVKAIMKDGVFNKSTYGLGADIAAVFQGLKARQSTWGWAPDEVLLEHNSFLTMLSMDDDIINHPAMKKVRESMQRAADKQVEMLVDFKAQRDVIKERLRKFMTEKGLDSGSYAKMIANYDDAAKSAASEIFRQHENAINRYANNLIESLSFTGIGISVGENSVRVNYGGRTIDISDLIPRLRTNAGGTLSWMLGENNTRYVATAGIGLNKDAFKLEAVSMLDYYQQDMFGGSKFRNMLQEAIETNRDPLDTFKWGLKVPKKMVSEHVLVKGSPSFDVRNMLYAELSPILDDKRSLERIINAASGRNLSELQSEAIDTLRDYYRSWDRVQPQVGLSQQKAILTLLSDDSPLLNPVISGSIRLNASAKQTGSDITRVAMAQVGSFSENINDPGKMLSHQLDNSLYFRVNRTKQEERILKDGGITDLAFGPRFATKMEQSIANVSEEGIDLSNRVVINALEANDAVKTQIYDMLVQKYENDKTIAAVFGQRFMPHEGGGLLSSRIMDVLQTPLNYQKVTWKPSLYRDMTEEQIRSFTEKAELQFAKLQDGTEEFVGYGKGVFVKKDKPLWSFYNKYFNDVRGTDAKRDSIVNVVYMTRNGGQIVDEETLRKNVGKQFNLLSESERTKEKWVEIADSMYDRKIVAQNIFDSGAVKAGVDSEKHESYTMARSISQFWNGGFDKAEQSWQKEEQLLHDIFFSKEFDEFGGRLSTDFRKGRSLSAKWYYDIANMNLSSPLFASEEEAEGIRTMIREKVGNFFNLKTEQDIDRKFYAMMDEARHRLSDDIKNLTGAGFLGGSMNSMTSHGNYDMILFSTTNWLEQQMQQNRGAIEMTNAYRKHDFAEAIRMINETGAITDRSGRTLSFAIDPETGAAIIETDNWKINRDKLRNVLSNFGFTGKEAENEWNIITSELRDVKNPGFFMTHRAEMRLTIDYAELDKLYKMSDRELISYTNTLFDDRIVDILQKNLSKEQFKSLMGQYVDENTGKLKAEYRNKSMWGEALDSHFRDTAFMTPNRIDPATKERHKLIGDVLFDVEKTKKKYAGDEYRATKTQDLVNRLAPQGKDANFATRVSQEYADDLYEYASLQQAVRYNSGTSSFSAAELITDSGKAKEFFKEAHIEDIDTFNIASKKHLMNPEYSMFRRNFLVDVTDKSIGLDEMTLGFNKIALAGVNLGGEGQADFQAKFKQLQDTYFDLKTLDRSSPEYNKALNKYRNLIRDVVDLQKDYASGDKIKSSVSARLMKSEVAGSLNNKVNVFQTEVTDSSLQDFLEKREYKGQNLADIYKSGRKVNFAVVSEADLANMGFDDKYFELHKIDKEEWLRKIEKEGIGGRAHRWPSDYWGSSMSVQIYLDRSRTSNMTAYDEITAAFMKADSDGDTAQLVVNSTRNANGQFIDEISAMKMNSALMDESAQKRIEAISKNQELQMQVQMLDTNNMIKRRTDYHKAYDELYEKYSKKVLTGKEADKLIAFGEKNPRMDLAGNIRPVNPVFLQDKEKQAYINAFDIHRERIASAIEQAGGDEQTIRAFRDSSAIDAVEMLQKKISSDFELRDKIYNALGDDADKINLAFNNAASITDSRIIALQRIARKGTGLADTPFTSMDFLRMNALAMDNVVISNSENVAMDMVKELTKEQLLTPKKMNIANITGITKNLDTLTTMLDDIMKNGKGNEKLKSQFIDFIAGDNTRGIEGIARDPNTRYRVESLLEFEKFGKINEDGKTVLDMRKIAAEAYEGYVKSIENLRQNSSIFDTIRGNVIDTSRGFKGRIGTLQALSNTQTARVNRAVATSNGIEEAWKNTTKELENIGDELHLGKIQEGRARVLGQAQNVIQKTIRDFRPSKSIALSALTLAGAAVFGGYAGGNPARPAQQHAQEIQEQNPPPRNINLADPSLTASNRKQAGYVININAQTERDKEYASRLITQAVTKNFQDTNVNISMNVNQQRSNISGNDLMDYLEQAL